MWHFRHIRHPLAAAVVAGALLLPSTLAAQAPGQPDPVEDLRRDLDRKLRDIPLAWKEREETLNKDIANLKTLSEFRRALALTEWKDFGDPRDPRTNVDLSARTTIGKKFKDGAENVIRTGNADARVALADMLGEMGAEVRSLNPKDTYGFGRSLTPELIRLTRDSNPDVKAAAARGLGKVFPDPSLAAPALKAVLETGNPLERMGAAQGLVNMIQGVYALQKTGRAQSGVQADTADVLAAARWIIDVAPPGLADGDARVRATTLDATIKSLNAFREQIPGPLLAKDLPPSGAKLSDVERKEVRRLRIELDDYLTRFSHVIDGTEKLGRRLAALLTDPAVPVRLEARKALEAIGDARLRLLRYITSVPTLPGEVGVKAPLQPVAQKGAQGKPDPIAKLSHAIEPGLHVIARGIHDPAVADRLTAVEFLESLEDASIPAIPVLVEALADSNRFVRWAAARAFGKMGPAQTDVVVPAVAKVLRDPDVDVAKQAAGTLQLFADQAGAAVPALAQAAALGDPEVSVASMRALGAMSSAVAAPSVSALITALANRDAEVRKTAAETLGKIGPRAREAVPALRVALRDDNSGVRRAASDAILSILAPVATK